GDALSKLVIDRQAASQECRAVRRRFDALASTVDQANAQHMLHLGNGLGNGRLREMEMACGLGHAALAHDRIEQPQIAELQPRGDAIHQIHEILSMKESYRTIINENFSFWNGRAR